MAWGKHDCETSTLSDPLDFTSRPSTTKDMTTLSLEVFDNEVVPSSLGSIVPILRVASEVEPEHPRVAYLCRFYAFEKACRLDPASIGRGVRQFKTSLIQQLERDSASTLAYRVKKTDSREIEIFYQQYYEHYVRALDKGEPADRDKLGKTYQTAGVLFEVSCGISNTEVSSELMAAAEDVLEKKDIYTPCNILPLGGDSASECIMHLVEVQGSLGSVTSWQLLLLRTVTALWSTRGLRCSFSSKEHSQKAGELDLDWPRALFGLQRASLSKDPDQTTIVIPRANKSAVALSNSLRRLRLSRIPPGWKRIPWIKKDRRTVRVPFDPGDYYACKVCFKKIAKVDQCQEVDQKLFGFAERHLLYYDNVPDSAVRAGWREGAYMGNFIGWNGPALRTELDCARCGIPIAIGLLPLFRLIGTGTEKGWCYLFKIRLVIRLVRDPLMWIGGSSFCKRLPF